MKEKDFKEKFEIMKKKIAKSDRVYIAGANGKKFAFLINADGYEISPNHETVDLYFRNVYVCWVDLSSVTDIN